MTADNAQESYALSAQDIQDILEPDTKIFTYPAFNDMSSIEEAFDPLGRSVFLFLTESPTSRHWLCMFKRRGHIEYFDSYGGRPDSQRKWLSPEELERLDESEPSLTTLLRRSGYRVYANTYPYQSKREDVSTCGRWVVARLICKDMSNEQFYHAVRRDMAANGCDSLDDWVTGFTADILGK